LAGKASGKSDRKLVVGRFPIYDNAVIRPGDRLAGFRKAVCKHVATWRVLFEVQIRCSLNSQCAILNRHGTARMAYLITVSKGEALRVYRQPAGPKMEILDKMSARREVIGDDWISRGGCRKAFVRPHD